MIRRPAYFWPLALVGVTLNLVGGIWLTSSTLPPGSLLFPVLVQVGGFVCLLGLVVVHIRYVVQAVREKEQGCRNCGYDLYRNESGVCPECGTKLESP